MINNISNIVQTQKIGEIKLQPVRLPKSLPQTGSFVKIEVLEKLKGNYKILVNGNLFQSRLPVSTKVGDILFAQVISGNPFTLSLDSFLAGKLGEAGIIAAVFSKLGLRKTAFADKFMARLLKLKKPLSKEKIKNALDFIETSDIRLDELQTAFLIAYFWDENGETFSQKKSIYRRVFDLNFNELIEAIYEKIVSLSGKNLEMSFYSVLKEKMIFEHENFADSRNVNAIFGKVKNAIELADFLEKYRRKPFVTESVAKELDLLKELLIKYVLQKSMLNKYGLYADFVITLAAEGLHLWRFEFVKVYNSKNEPIYKLESAVLTRSNELIDAKIFISETKIQGEIRTENKMAIKESVKRLNETLARKLAVDAGIRPYGEQFYSI